MKGFRVFSLLVALLFISHTVFAGEIDLLVQKVYCVQEKLNK